MNARITTKIMVTMQMTTVLATSVANAGNDGQGGTLRWCVPIDMGYRGTLQRAVVGAVLLLATGGLAGGFMREPEVDDGMDFPDVDERFANFFGTKPPTIIFASVLSSSGPVCRRNDVSFRLSLALSLFLSLSLSLSDRTARVRSLARASHYDRCVVGRARRSPKTRS